MEAEKQRIDQNAIQKQNELTEALEKLKTANEQMVKTKDEKIAQMASQLEKIKGASQVTEFRKEASLIKKCANISNQTLMSSDRSSGATMRISYIHK